jgi:hypothetical protein
MFAADFEPAERTSRRCAPRAPVSLDVSIGKTRRTLCRVVDISVHGVRLQTDDFTAGCKFRTPLSTATFEALIGKDPAN